MKHLARFRKAAALPFVLLLVALNVIVVVALLVYATTELQASRNSGQAEVARAIAQSGIDIAAGLIAANSTNNGFVSYQRVTYAPGDPNPRLETKIGNVTNDPSTPWKTAVVTNTNDPRRPSVLHSGFAAGTDGVDLNFAVRGDPSSGFIAPRTNLSGWTNLSTNMFRMDWIYVYKGPTNDPKNLVGRVAYWVDDESSKLNVNYSGITNFYSTNNYTWGAGYSQFSIVHGSLSQANMLGEKWPIQMEFGGIGGISSTNAFYIIDSRGVAKTNNFTPYPSVLGARIGTIGKPGGLALTNLLQQAAFGFSATVYSKEEERSYSAGQKRYDLLNLYAGAPEAATVAAFQAAITSNPSCASFASKYDLPSFAEAIYARVQSPGGGASTAPANTNGSALLYNRGLPRLNEVSIKVMVANENGTNTANVTTDLSFIILSKSTPPADQYSWITFVGNSPAYTNAISFSPNVIFGLPIANQSITPSPGAWYSTTSNLGPTNSTFFGAIKKISSSTNIGPTTTAQALSFPTNVTVSVMYNGQVYQKLQIPISTNVPVAGTNQTNISVAGANQTNVFHLVSQPSGDGGYRGDPRFGAFKSYIEIAINTNSSSLQPSLGTLNTNSVNSVDPPNWQVDTFATDANKPDLVQSSLFFGPDRGIPQFTRDKSQGFGWGLPGLGWIGEVPVTTPSGSPLAWSTPRLWGDGRPLVNGTVYPPDWLLLDLFHMAAYAGEPTSAPANQQTYSSYGRVNVNAAKPFFQIARNSKSQSDTIVDSVIVKAETIDFREYHNNGAPIFDPIPNLPTKNIPFVGDATNATNYRGLVLSRIQQMISDRNSIDNPYTTHFEFLADLAATNLQYNPDWWEAPDTNNPTHSIYAATNTTDRRIEGIVRSLVQKFTTHGNQFSIFTLGQALQLAPNGTVTAPGNTNRYSVVGESYMQSV